MRKIKGRTLRGIDRFDPTDDEFRLIAGDGVTVGPFKRIIVVDVCRGHTTALCDASEIGVR